MSTQASPPAVPPAWLVDLGDRVAQHPQLLAKLPTALAHLPFGIRHNPSSLSTTTTTTAPSTPAPAPPANDAATWDEYQRWIHAQARVAVKALFDAGVATESPARPAIHAYLVAAAGQGAPTHATRSSSSSSNGGSTNNKRKRVLNSDEDDGSDESDDDSEKGTNPATTAPSSGATPPGTESLLPPPTPISELYVPPPPASSAQPVGALHDSVEAAQLWTQLELRHAALDGVCERAVQMDTKDDEDQDEDEEQSVFKVAPHNGPSSSGRLPGIDRDDDRKNADEDEDDEDEDGDDDQVTDEDLAHLASLSNSQLQAIGFAPQEIAKVRTELRKRGVVAPDAAAKGQQQSAEEDEADFSEEDDFGFPSDEQDEDEEDEGFAGASDLSDDEEASRITFEPLQEEADQLRRKDLFGLVGDDDEEDDDSDSDNSLGESDSDDDLAEDPPTPAAHGSASSSNNNNHKQVSTISLDDGFFNLESFNRDLLAAEAKEPSTDIDLFTDPATWNADDEEDQDQDGHDNQPDLDDLTYESFFAPPSLPASSGLQKERKGANHPKSDQPPLPGKKGQGKGKSKALSSSSTKGVSDDTTSGRGKIRFSDQVQVRRIKRAPGMRAPEPEESIPFLGSPPRAQQQQESDEDDQASDDAEEEDESDESEDDQAAHPQSDDDELDMDLDDPSGDEQEEGESEGEDDGSVEGTARRVAQDLFADDDQPTGTDSMHSTYEKRQAALQAEMAALEAENVGFKDWELGGEASATSRPKDAALEVDMDFIHSLKSAPLATAEHQEDLDDLIRRRILAEEWNDVPRRVALGDPRDFLPSKLAQLSDQKSQQSLAELYEQEYTQATAGGDKPTSEADAKLAVEHEQLTTLIESVFSQLDRLSNAHYTPRPADVRAGQVTAAPTGGIASMATEQALPEVANGATQQAPHEVYDPHSRTGVLNKGGTRVSRSFVGNKNELSASEKKKEHEQLRRLKRARNDAGSSSSTSSSAGGSHHQANGKYQSAKAEKQTALQSLVREPGVAVVGSDGSRNKMVNKRGQLERAKAPSAPETGKLKL